MDAHIYMSKQTKQSSRNEIISFGAHLHLVDGDLADVCAILNHDSKTNHWYNLSCQREPYRLEGIKTIGFEIARQMDWNPPDWILFPSMSVAGVVGLCKAFAELLEMGWITKKPKLAWVQVIQTPNSINSILPMKIRM